MVHLSKRLQAVAGFVTEGSRLADIGTDHAYIPVWLMQNGKIKKAIAMDINSGPLMRAKQHIDEAGLGQRIELRTSDGAKALIPGEADCAVIAGMGGRLMQNILQEGEKIFAGMREIILQPQSELCMLRHFLQDSGYMAVDEDMVLEDGKFYTVMKLRKGRNTFQSEMDFCYGKLLLDQKHTVLLQFLKKEQVSCEHIIQKLISLSKEERGRTEREERLCQIEKELDMIHQALQRIK